MCVEFHQTLSVLLTHREFLHTYSECNAILLPGRIPGYKRTDVELLPSSTTKQQVWQQYCASLVTSTTHHQVAYSTFCTIWRRVVPHIMVTKPMSDFCWICQSNSTAIMRSANQPEEQKSAVSTYIIYVPPGQLICNWNFLPLLGYKEG